MKTKTFIIILALGLLPYLAEAQFYSPLPKFYRPIDSATIAKNKQEQLKKGEADFGMTMGAGYSSFAGGAMNSYIAPNMKYQVTENFQLNVRSIISRSSINMSQGGSFAANQGQPTGFGFSSSGIYNPTEKLSVRFSGTYMENDQSMMPLKRSPQQNYNMNYKAMSFGVGYKISKKTSINFEFSFSNGTNNMYSPYHNNYYSPFSRPYNHHGYDPFKW
jgi:hypothetical protein